MKTKKIIMILILSVLVLAGVYAKSITKWWSGYTLIDDFVFGKVNTFFRAWDYDDGSKVLITVYVDPAETRVRYKNTELGNKARVPFAQITEISSKGVRSEYNLADYPDKFKDFQFTLYSATPENAEFSFSGTVVTFNSNVGLISDRVSQAFNKSDASSVSDITFKAEETKETTEKDIKSNFDKGIDFLHWLLSEPEPPHPDGSKICSYCHGNGKCVYCHGSGKDTSGILSYCPKCDFMGNGLCSYCHGQGWTF